MDLALAYMPGLTLALLRATAMFAVMMFLGTGGDSRWPRLILAVGTGAVLFLRSPATIDVGTSLAAFGVVAAREVVLGLALGFAIQVIYFVLHTAGSLLGHEMGFSLAQIVDPTTGVSSPVVGRFFETVSFLFLLAIDGHHQIFRVLADACDRIPVGSPFDLGGLYLGLRQLTSDGLQLAISLASPVYAALLLTTVVLVLLARVVPQIHLMEFGYALRILIALVSMLLFMGTAGPFIYRMFHEMFARVGQLVALTAG